MTLSVAQSRTTQEQQDQRQDRGFEHLAAPALSKTLEMFVFPKSCEVIKILHLKAPQIFEGLSPSDGTTLPNRSTVRFWAAFNKVMGKLALAA